MVLLKLFNDFVIAFLYWQGVFMRKTASEIMENNLEIVFPQIASEWHPLKNGNLKAKDVSPYSNKKVWWICEKGHEWQVSPSSRAFFSSGCPYCSNHKVWPGYNDLATINPDLASEWHPDKNGTLTPKDVVAGSNKNVWWRGKCGHEWISKIVERNNGAGCPFCTNHKLLVGYNDLATINPDLALEWHPSKNMDLTPQDVMAGSNKKVWWSCSKCGNEWKAGICTRNARTGCPKCSVVKQTSIPEQAIFFYVKKFFPDAINRYKELFCNNLEVDVYIPSKSIAIEYDGIAWHYSERHYYNERLKYKLCKQYGIKLIRIREDADNSEMQTSDTLIFSEYRNRNYDALNPVISKVLHALEIDALVDIHRDLQEIEKSSLGNIYNQSLLVQNPELAKEWHPTKNGSLTPDSVFPSASVKVWWKGKCGHEWQNTINTRAAGRGCPYCSSKKILIGFNDLESTNPELAKEWHPTKNENLTPRDVTFGSNKLVWWKCEKNHEWKARVADRTRTKGNCPYCCNQRVLEGYNDLSTLNPSLASEWHPVKNGKLTPKMVTLNSNKKAWWLCNKCGWEWQTKIGHRSSGSGCPNCYRKRGNTRPSKKY